MSYYSAEQSMTSIGIYMGYKDGYYSFVLENNDVIDFEEINKMILVKFDLKSDELKERKFEINYKEIIDDLDDEDFIVLKLDSINLL